MQAADRPIVEPFDYDTNPQRRQLTKLAAEKYSLIGDAHEVVVKRFVGEGITSVLDVGCGTGKLMSLLHAEGVKDVVGIDRSPMQLSMATGVVIRGDASALPFPDNTFGGAAALYMLYHLSDPAAAVAECYRVLQPGGLFAARAASIFASPELASVLPDYGVMTTFQSDNGVEVISDVFDDLQVNPWDGPYVHLPDREALVLYLRGRRLSVTEAERAAGTIDTPLTLTKKGAIFYGRKPG